MKPVLSSVGKILWLIFIPSYLLLTSFIAINNIILKLGLYFISVIFIFIYLRRKNPDIIQEKQRPSIKEFFLIILLIWVIGFISINLSIITDRFYPVPTSDINSLSNGELFYLTVLVAPVIEEIFFRGLIFQRMLPFGIGFAFLFNSVIFALSHIYLTSMFSAIFVGLILSYSAFRYGIQWSIIFHALNNALIVLILFISRHDITIFVDDGINITAAMLITLILVIIAVLGIIYFMIMGIKHRTVIKNLWVQYRPQSGQWLEIFKNPWLMSYIIVLLIWSISTFFDP